ncbi:peptidoglycan editing factor PgeF [Acidothermaceae bacterium B102]|nr:peptidoglycan editing factor PgeF [Acidothermaceae bacterium B102]
MSRPVQPTPVDLGPGVGAVFANRYGGVSLPPYDELNLAFHVDDDWDRVFANRSLVSAAIGSAPDRSSFVHQVHGNAVVTIAPHEVGTVRLRQARRDADAMVTTALSAPLVVLVADCLPVLLADPVARVVGAVHAGRRGMAAGVVTATVEAMVEAGARVGDLRAAIGPGVCAACYEVPAAMAAEVDAAVPGTAAVTPTGSPSLDLTAGVRSQLAALGVSQVSVDGRCTVESPELFSYRRDGVTGRFAGLVWLEP